jgi:hypothetical protein
MGPEVFWPVVYVLPHGGPASLLGHHKNWSGWTWVWWPPLSCFWSTQMQLSLFVWISQEPSDLSGLDLDSPSSIACKSPLSSLWDSIVGQSLHIYIPYTINFCLITDCIYFFHDFPIITYYCQCYFLILEMCSRYFDPVNIKHLWVIKHHNAWDSPTSVLV